MELPRFVVLATLARANGSAHIYATRECGVPLGRG